MNKKIITLFAFVALLTSPIIVLAADPATWFTDIVSRFLDYIVWPVFISFVVLMFIWSGFLFATAQGEPSKISTAKKAFLWAIIGIAVAIIGFSAVKIVTRILGV